MNAVTKWVWLPVALVLLVNRPAGATIYSYAEGDHEFGMDGRYRQSINLGYHRYGRGKADWPGPQIQPIGSEYLLELVSGYSYKNWARLKLDLNLWGDSMYMLRRNDTTFGNAIEPDPSTGSNRAFVPYGKDALQSSAMADGCINSTDCKNFVRDFLVREASLVLSDRSAGYNVTIGKFQRGWGQADGLRLMDVINPLDFRKRFLFRDFDELRINQWMIDSMFFVDPYISFERFGIYNPNFEFIWNPNIRHTEYRINNPFVHESGGVWGIPFPTRKFSPDGPFPDRVFLTTPRVTAGDSWIDPGDAAYAGRFAWNMFNADFTVAGYYGWQDLHITRLLNAELHQGHDGHGPLLATLDPATAQLAYNLVNAGTFNLNTCTPGGGTGLPALPAGVPDGCSVVANVALDFEERKKLVGFTATRELSFLRIPPKSVSPVFRLETTYEFDAPFNTVVLVAPDQQSVAHHDFWSSLVGLDFFLWFPDSWYGNAVLTNKRAVFTSFQVFVFRALGNGPGDKRVIFRSPFIDWSRNTSERWLTFLWFTDVYKDLIHLEGLNIYQLDHLSFLVRQRADFRFFGDWVIPRIELIHIEGSGDQVGGLLRASSQLNFELTFQF